MSKAERQLTLMPLLIGNIRLCLFVLNACTRRIVKVARRERAQAVHVRCNLDGMSKSDGPELTIL